MHRRQYFLFPDRDPALSAVNELAASGVCEDDMHALAAREGLLDGLPNATNRQIYDTSHRLENLLWSASLALFCLAFGGFYPIADPFRPELLANDQ
jgi:hypothetical protein